MTDDKNTKTKSLFYVISRRFANFTELISLYGHS